MTRPVSRLVAKFFAIAAPVSFALPLTGCGEPGGAGSVEIKADAKEVAGQMFPQAPGKAAGKSASVDAQPKKK